MLRYYYADSIEEFRISSEESILGRLLDNSEFDVRQTQRDAWKEQIRILKDALKNQTGHVFFEYSIPRMGKRIDVVVIIHSVIFALEFKAFELEFKRNDIDQVWDYALDLKNFHETSHKNLIAPILVATDAKPAELNPSLSKEGHIIEPLKSNGDQLADLILHILKAAPDNNLEPISWSTGRYSPTPTIVEAAQALYQGHSVDAISRSDAGAINLSSSSKFIEKVISRAKEEKLKAICFLTGVPGAGKTLVGLNIASRFSDPKDALHSVFLSGNGPLVKVLQEALARDRVKNDKLKNIKTTKKAAASEVKAFIQNIHHFRDDCLADDNAPIEHVTLFDEAQRAWDLKQTSSFMKRKKGHPDFNQSEPEYLISCLDRHKDWAVIVCLVGGGQEIHTGEAGISEWISSLNRSFPDWQIYLSPHLTDKEYGSGEVLHELEKRQNVTYSENLHLSTSMRSFRSENVSHLIKCILDLESDDASDQLAILSEKYPIVITRNLDRAKAWLRSKARGSERYGIVASSQAERLRPHCIDVKRPVDPIHWFLQNKDDVRSSYYLEDAATEFQVQGLELDWTCVTWDADLRFKKGAWQHWSFQGSKWNHIRKDERKKYQLNAYRVLLTRARQGMAIFVPPGASDDPTRDPKYYDDTYFYLQSIGFEEI